MRSLLTCRLNRGSPLFIASFIVLGAFSIRWEDLLPGSEGFTSLRLVCFLSIMMLLLWMLRSMGKQLLLGLRSDFLIVALGWLMLFCISFVSAVVNLDSLDKMDLSHIVAWLLMATITLSLGAFSASESGHKYFVSIINYNVLLSCVIIIGTFIKLSISLEWDLGLYTPGNVQGYFLQGSTGLNRYLNGICLLQSFLSSYLLFFHSIKYRISLYSLALVSSVVSIGLMYMSGSRQNLYTCLITIVALGLYKLVFNFRRLSNLLVSVFVICLLALVAVSSLNQYGIASGSYFKNRFIDRTLERDLAGTSQRPKVYLSAIDLSSRNLTWGVGPGAFPSYGYKGYDTHNSYLGVLTQGGAVSLFIYVLMLGLFLFLLCVGRNGLAGGAPLVLMLCFILMINLNDLQFSLYPVALLLLSVAGQSHARSQLE